MTAIDDEALARLRAATIGRSDDGLNWPVVEWSELIALLDIAEAVQWQPIASAPMDGELVCVCRPGMPHSWPAWWRQRTAFDRRHKTGWHSGSNAPLKFRPTHWMPLPKPPAVVPCTGGGE